jgi:hypothetical protein
VSLPGVTRQSSLSAGSFWIAGSSPTMTAEEAGRIDSTFNLTHF